MRVRIHPALPESGSKNCPRVGGHASSLVVRSIAPAWWRIVTCRYKPQPLPPALFLSSLTSALELCGHLWAGDYSEQNNLHISRWYWSGAVPRNATVAAEEIWILNFWQACLILTVCKLWAPVRINSGLSLTIRRYVLEIQRLLSVHTYIATACMSVPGPNPTQNLISEKQ